MKCIFTGVVASGRLTPVERTGKPVGRNRRQVARGIATDRELGGVGESVHGPLSGHERPKGIGQIRCTAATLVIDEMADTGGLSVIPVEIADDTYDWNVRVASEESFDLFVDIVLDEPSDPSVPGLARIDMGSSVLDDWKQQFQFFLNFGALGRSPVDDLVVGGGDGPAVGVADDDGTDGTGFYQWV